MARGILGKAITGAKLQKHLSQSGFKDTDYKTVVQHKSPYKQQKLSYKPHKDKNMVLNIQTIK